MTPVVDLDPVVKIPSVVEIYSVMELSPITETSPVATSPEVGNKNGCVMCEEKRLWSTWKSSIIPPNRKEKSSLELLIARFCSSRGRLKSK